MSLKNGRYQSEPDEIGQQVAHGRTAGPAILAALVQREAILLFQYIQQVLFLLRKGQECPFLLLGVLPHLEMQLYKRLEIRQCKSSRFSKLC